jgi:DNA-directed RNA polymerase subunit RPC12/RpoP
MTNEGRRAGVRVREMNKRARDEETIQGNCIRCGRRRAHLVRKSSTGTEYFECLTCGNKVDIKAFVYDNLDALD